MIPLDKMASGTSLLLMLFCFTKPYDCLANACSARAAFTQTCPKFEDYTKGNIRSVIFEQQSMERESRMVNVRERVGTERLVNNRRIVDSDSRISNFPAAEKPSSNDERRAIRTSSRNVNERISSRTFRSDVRVPEERRDLRITRDSFTDRAVTTTTDRRVVGDRRVEGTGFTERTSYRRTVKRVRDISPPLSSRVRRSLEDDTGDRRVDRSVRQQTIDADRVRAPLGESRERRSSRISRDSYKTDDAVERNVRNFRNDERTRREERRDTSQRRFMSDSRLERRSSRNSVNDRLATAARKDFSRERTLDNLQVRHRRSSSVARDTRERMGESRAPVVPYNERERERTLDNLQVRHRRYSSVTRDTRERMTESCVPDVSYNERERKRTLDNLQVRNRRSSSVARDTRERMAESRAPGVSYNERERERTFDNRQVSHRRSSIDTRARTFEESRTPADVSNRERSFRRSALGAVRTPQRNSIRVFEDDSNSRTRRSAGRSLTGDRRIRERVSDQEKTRRVSDRRTSERSITDTRRISVAPLQRTDDRTTNLRRKPIIIQATDVRYRASDQSRKDENNNGRVTGERGRDSSSYYNTIMDRKTVNIATWSNVITTALSVLLFAHVISSSLDLKRVHRFKSFLHVTKEKVL